MKATLSNPWLRLFFVVGMTASSVLWLSAILFSDGPLTLMGPAGASLLSALFLVLGKGSRLAMSFTPSSAIYNFLVMAYQAATSPNIIYMGLTTLGTISLIAYVLGALFFALLSVLSLANPQLFFHRELSLEESRKGKS